MNRLLNTLFLINCLVLAWIAFYPASALAEDQYEPDNNFMEAQDIGIYDIDQIHTFHNYFDQDWVRFTADKGKTYEFTSDDPSADCDPVIELFAPDGTTLLKRLNEAGLGSPEHFRWICPVSGNYFFRFTNNSQYYNETVHYRIIGFFIVSGPSIPGYLTGRVTSGDSGVSGVSFRAANGAATSLSDGSYIIGLEEGPVTVTVHKEGYESQSFTVTIIENSTIHRDITLDRIAEPNKPPTIKGTPKTEIMPNTLYSFQAESSDPEGNSIVFSIVNKPAWLHFNSDDGRLLGIPDRHDIGRHGPITLTAIDSMGASSNLPPFTIEVLNGGFGPGSLLLLIH